MGYRKTGEFRRPSEVEIQTCDICTKDIDGASEYPNYELTRNNSEPHYEGDGCRDQATMCSIECLEKAIALMKDGDQDWFWYE